MSAAPGLVAARRGWLFVTGTMAEAFLVYAVVGWFLARGRGADAEGAGPSAALFYGTATALVAAAVLLARRGAAPGASRVRFQRSSLFAMGVLELNALLGLVLSVLSRRLEPALTLPGISLAATVLFVFPAGLAFWKRSAAAVPRDTGSPPSIAPS